MTIFENPSNGHREQVKGIVHLWALLFGIFYFLYKGLWPHVAVQMLFIIFAAEFEGPFSDLMVTIVWLAYGVAARRILEAHYRRRGWIEVDPRESAKAEVARAAARLAAPEKTCPRCAETVKNAARICRFCGHEFAAGAPAPPTIDTAPATPHRFAEGARVRHVRYGDGTVITFGQPGRTVVRFAEMDRDVKDEALTAL